MEYKTNVVGTLINLAILGVKTSAKTQDFGCSSTTQCDIIRNVQGLVVTHD